MSLTEDLQQILETVLPTDPSFRRIEGDVIDKYINDCQRCTSEGSIDAFLLSAMRLLALPGNGHTRLIPNDAISVLPLRLVSVECLVHVVAAAPGINAPQGELIAINGVAVGQIEACAQEFLAGTRQRKRVIGPVLLAWPYALDHLGFASQGSTTWYRVQDENGRITDLELANSNTVPASTLYPRNEHGKADPAWRPETFAEIKDWPELGLSIRLPSLFDPDKTALQKAISDASDRVDAHSHKPLLIDVRGNTGGDFLLTMPLIDAISRRADQQVVVLVDKFTFSAAIVFVAILKHRLGNSLKLVGEEPGDGLTFFAEGGLLNLPNSQAVVRYASAFHDWKNGTSDATTPPEIACRLVPAGALNLDWEIVDKPNDADRQGAFYQRVLERARD